MALPSLANGRLLTASKLFLEYMLAQALEIQLETLQCLAKFCPRRSIIGLTKVLPEFFERGNNMLFQAKHCDSGYVMQSSSLRLCGVCHAFRRCHNYGFECSSVF